MQRVTVFQIITVFSSIDRYSVLKFPKDFKLHTLSESCIHQSHKDLKESLQIYMRFSAAYKSSNPVVP